MLCRAVCETIYIGILRSTFRSFHPINRPGEGKGEAAAAGTMALGKKVANFLTSVMVRAAFGLAAFGEMTQLLLFRKVPR